MRREIIEIESDEQWLELRGRDITSTSVSAMFDLSPYVTVFELYHAHKNGLQLPFKETDRIKKGKRMEQYAAQEVAESFGATVKPLNVYARIPEIRMGSSFDYELTMPDGEMVLLELKAVDYFIHKENWKDGELPPHIEVQVQHQMECIDAYERCIVAPFTGIYDFHIYERKRDRDFGASLISATKKFWADVETGNEPKPDFYRDGDAIRALHSTTDDKPLDKTGDAQFSALLSKFYIASEQKKHWEKECEALKAEGQFLLADAGLAFTEDYKVTASYTKDSQGTLVTPEMVGTYIGARKGYRQFKVTDLTKKKGKQND